MMVMMCLSKSENVDSFSASLGMWKDILLDTHELMGKVGDHVVDSISKIDTVKLMTDIYDIKTSCQDSILKAKELAAETITDVSSYISSIDPQPLQENFNKVQEYTKEKLTVVKDNVYSLDQKDWIQIGAGAVSLPIGISALGFKTGGILASSMATKIMAMATPVAKLSLTAKLQSAGVVGASYSTYYATAAFGGLMSRMPISIPSWIEEWLEDDELNTCLNRSRRWKVKWMRKLRKNTCRRV